MVATAPMEVVSSTAHTDADSFTLKKSVIASITAKPPESNPELTGWRPTPQVQSKLDMIVDEKPVEGVPKCHLMPTPSERFKQLCIEFPKHITMTLAACLVPCLGGVVSVLISGMYYRALVTERSEFIGSLNDIDGNNQQHISSSLFTYNLFRSVIGRVPFYLLGVTAPTVLFSSKKLLKPLLKVNVPCFVIHTLLTVMARISKRGDGCFALSDGRVFIVQALIVFVSTIFTGRTVQRFTKQPGFTVLYACLMFLLIGITGVAYNNVIWPFVVEGSDSVKLIMAAFVNPLMYEFVLSFSRVLARAIPHAHESTLPILVSVVIASKKMMGRFIIGLMTTPSFVLIASIILGFAEFAFIATLAKRDRLLYHSCFGACVPKSYDVLNAMRKNKLMRVRCAHMETVLEVCFTIISGCLIVMIMDISLDGNSKPVLGPLIGNVIIQIGCEVIVDFACATWLTVLAKQPMLAVAHLNFKGWTVWMMVLMFFSSFYIMDSVVMNIVGNAGDHDSLYIQYLTDRFKNTTAVTECD